MFIAPTVDRKCLGVTRRNEAFLPQQQTKPQAPFFALRDVPEPRFDTSWKVGQTLCRGRPLRPWPAPCRVARFLPPAATPETAPMPATPPTARPRLQHESILTMDPP